MKKERMKEGRTIIYLLNKKVRFFSGYVEQIDVDKLSEKADSIEYIFILMVCHLMKKMQYHL